MILLVLLFMLKLIHLWKRKLWCCFLIEKWIIVSIFLVKLRIRGLLISVENSNRVLIRIFTFEAADLCLEFKNHFSNLSLNLTLIQNEKTNLFFFNFLIEVLHTDPASAAANQASKEETDSRSVFVGNVRIRISLFLL